MTKLFPILFASLLLSQAISCSNNKEISEKNPKVKLEKGEQMIWVNSYRSSCEKNAADGDYFLTSSNSEIDPNQWECIYREIEKFPYEAGYIYQIKVRVTKKEGLPALEYLETISKERDADYFRIFNIWGLTQIGETPIDPATQASRLEVNLTTGRILGNGACNELMGGITHFTPTEISFGPIGSTKKMCGQMGVEKKYFNALAETTSYHFEKGMLILTDNKGTALLRFKPID